MTTDPYAETDDWPTVPATRPHSHAQPVSAPEPSGSTREAGEGARAARYAEAIGGVLDVFDTVMNVKAECREVARAVMAVADQETADLRAERDSIFGKAIEFKRKYIETEARAEAAEAESARLASEQRELAAQVAGLRSVVAKVEALADEWEQLVKDHAAAAERDGCPRDEAMLQIGAGGARAGASSDLRAALASVAPDTATPGEVWVDTPDDFDGYDTATPGEADAAGECAACGHRHSPNLGGICIGCPCEEGGWR